MNFLRYGQVIRYSNSQKWLYARTLHVNKAQLNIRTVEIPNSIPRKSTDILIALSNVAGNDSTSAHYKYHDDPYLIPTSNISKRTYGMALASGRKAAKWIKENHAELFQHQVGQPAFPPVLSKITEQTEVTEDTLRNLIRDVRVTDAILVYNLLISKDINPNNELKQNLLELICFCNDENILSEELMEEKWFRHGSNRTDRTGKTLKITELAHKIFNDIEPKNSKSYSALINGMCKYLDVERAWSMFQNAYDKHIELDIKTFNSIISIGSYLKESGDMRWEFCKNILEQMNEQKIKPNLGTLNATLSTISTIGNFRLARQAALKLLSEFKSLNIEPSLATWYYLLIIYCRERGKTSFILLDILKEIENKEFQIIDPKDIYFFVTAMDVCHNHLHDKNLAKRINNLLHFGNNYDLIGDSYKESIYYRHYFGILCETEPLEVFMETYDQLVPNIYIPEPGVMEEILKTIDMNGALHLLPRIWSDMVIFDHIKRENLLIRILKIMCDNKQNTKMQSDNDLNKLFANIADEIYTKFEQSEQGNQKLVISAQVLGDILTLVLRSENWEKAQIIFNKLDKNQHQISGLPNADSLELFVDTCIVQKNLSNAINCLQYCVTNGIESNNLAKKIYDGFTLTENEINKMKNLVGTSSLIE